MSRVLFRDLPDAGLGRRLAAAFYDGLLLLALWFVIGFALAVAASAVSPRDLSGPIEPLVPPALAPVVTPPALWLISTLFCGWFWRHGGQTLGMKTWRLYLVRTDGSPLRWRDVGVRMAVATVSWLALGLGYFWVLVDGRTWHDRASGTRVVRLPPGALT